jgi:ribonucleotide monophosphatase NagD (HAD superfamily)
METILVLSGVVRAEDVRRFPYQPRRIVSTIGDIEL